MKAFRLKKYIARGKPGEILKTRKRPEEQRNVRELIDTVLAALIGLHQINVILTLRNVTCFLAVSKHYSSFFDSTITLFYVAFSYKHIK